MASLRRTTALLCAAVCALGAAALLVALTSRSDPGDAADVRPPAVAGAFYPASADALRAGVEGYLKAASPAVPADLRDVVPRALIVPHAGYQYSGPTAAFGYKLLEGRKRPSRVVVIGPSHHAALAGVCAVADFSGFATPLGIVPVDADACAELLKAEPFRAMRAPHGPEHCIEVQLPFVQVLWPEAPKIVPILAGELSPEQSRAAAAGIARILDDDTLIIVSTDFTHYGQRFGFAPFAGVHGVELAAKIRELDMGAVKAVETLDPPAFRSYVARTGATICGRVPVGVLLDLASQSRSSRAAFLRWDNSGETTGGYEDCVSYVAAAAYTPGGALEEIRKALAAQSVPPQTAAAAAANAPELTDDDKRLLLKVARAAITLTVSGGDTTSPPPRPGGQVEFSQVLRRPRGAFVTLKKDGELRGCIGRIESDRPLWITVREMAVMAATEDPRFKPVTKEELPQITIEISALTPIQRAKGIDDIQVGRDGLIVKAGYAQGLLLPQVATEYGWDAREFLQQTCRKAGLPTDAWQWENVAIYKFGATVFGEAEGKKDQPAASAGPGG